MYYVYSKYPYEHRFKNLTRTGRTLGEALAFIQRRRERPLLGHETLELRKGRKRIPIN